MKRFIPPVTLLYKSTVTSPVVYFLLFSLLFSSCTKNALDLYPETTLTEGVFIKMNPS